MEEFEQEDREELESQTTHLIEQALISTIKKWKILISRGELIALDQQLFLFLNQMGSKLLMVFGCL